MRFQQSWISPIIAKLNVKWDYAHCSAAYTFLYSTKNLFRIVEWEALYTTHITQKAKKYHDGFIRMIICGSEGRQVGSNGL